MANKINVSAFVVIHMHTAYTVVGKITKQIKHEHKSIEVQGESMSGLNLMLMGILCRIQFIKHLRQSTLNDPIPRQFS